MEGVPKKDFSNKSGDVSIADYAVKDKTIIFPKKEADTTELAALAGDISSEAANIINQYRQVRHVSMCNQSFQLLKAANIRAKEILTSYSHLRPDGTEGMDAPYTYGYPRWNTITREVIGAYETESTEWLKNDAAQAVLDLFLKSVPDFLAGDNSTEHAVGIYINFDGKKYNMGISYICALVNPKPQPQIQPQPKVSPVRKPESLASDYRSDGKPVDKAKLVYAYNLSNFLKEEDYTFGSWTNFIIAKGDAKQVYKDATSTQRQVDNAVIALNNAMDYLQKTIKHPKI